MPRPKSKDDLLKAAQDNFETLLASIEGIPTQKRETAGVCEEWSIKDILAHLHEWHNMMSRWYRDGMAGTNPEIPAPGFTWKTTPELNNTIYKQHKDSDYKKIVTKLKQTHNEMLNLIDSHSDQELFTKKKYAWTGSTSLGAYLISATSSHYDWANGLIKKWKKKQEL